MDLATIKQLAFDHLGNKNSHPWKEKGNKYYHGERVASLALKLRKIILPKDDSYDDILTVAAWFHDIKNGDEEHAVKGAKKTREVLHKYCTAKELDSICEIIAVHDDRYSGKDTFPIYTKIHQDADHLDHFGTFDIWTCFIYAIGHGQSMNEVMEFLYQVRPTEDAKYRRELNFDISRKIYDEKAEFVKNFSERFKVEVEGGIWNLEEILNKLEGSF